MMLGAPAGPAGPAAAASLAARGLAAAGDALVRAGLPDALVRWWVAPWVRVPATRDEALQLAAGGGGALLVAYAAWAHGAHRASAPQVRGLLMAGVGLLMTAGSSAALRAHGPVGPAVSVAGALLLLKASLLLARERQAQRERGGSGRPD
jgi:hypothetical protein